MDLLAGRIPFRAVCLPQLLPQASDHRGRLSSFSLCFNGICLAALSAHNKSSFWRYLTAFLAGRLVVCSSDYWSAKRECEGHPRNTGSRILALRTGFLSFVLDSPPEPTRHLLGSDSEPAAVEAARFIIPPISNRISPRGPYLRWSTPRDGTVPGALLQGTGAGTPATQARVLQGCLLPQRNLPLPLKPPSPPKRS